jgi:hypothetical protein
MKMDDLAKYFPGARQAPADDGARQQAPTEAPLRKTRRRLFTKYVALL